MRPRLRSNRLVALFLLAVVLFNPPVLKIFDQVSTSASFGIPWFYIYIFAAWLLIIFLAAKLTQRRPTKHSRHSLSGGSTARHDPTPEA